MLITAALSAEVANIRLTVVDLCLIILLLWLRNGDFVQFWQNPVLVRWVCSVLTEPSTCTVSVFSSDRTQHLYGECVQFWQNPALVRCLVVLALIQPCVSCSADCPRAGPCSHPPWTCRNVGSVWRTGVWRQPGVLALSWWGKFIRVTCQVSRSLACHLLPVAQWIETSPMKNVFFWNRFKGMYVSFFEVMNDVTLTEYLRDEFLSWLNLSVYHQKWVKHVQACSCWTFLTSWWGETEGWSPHWRLWTV